MLWTREIVKDVIPHLSLNGIQTRLIVVNLFAKMPEKILGACRRKPKISIISIIISLQIKIGEEGIELIGVNTGNNTLNASFVTATYNDPEIKESDNMFQIILQRATRLMPKVA
jgi:hypothetical protein